MYVKAMAGRGARALWVGPAQGFWCSGCGRWKGPWVPVCPVEGGGTQLETLAYSSALLYDNTRQPVEGEQASVKTLKMMLVDLYIRFAVQQFLPPVPTCHCLHSNTYYLSLREFQQFSGYSFSDSSLDPVQSTLVLPFEMPCPCG